MQGTNPYDINKNINDPRITPARTGQTDKER